ncbi:hypothetical protein H4R18_002666 [Coemansia javaensis]|uniref:Transmembrane protein n=1 Tax=Coemansia javaensis TaxID=2761396 RepID=A0A9W8LHF0_9FUNG|nr:hypothetical protein H4R18_002666 [Coemansia javaensis]
MQSGAVARRKALAQFRDRGEVVVYDRGLKDTHYSWGPWVAAGQMLMWINFADFYWRYTMDKDEDTGELTPAPLWKRACISGIALAAGASIGAGLLHFVTRSVARMRVVDNGATVVLETYRLSGRGTRAARFPIAALYSRDTLHTGSGPNGVSKPGLPQYSIYAGSGSYAYIMNRDGAFHSPKTFDTLFHRDQAPQGAAKK